MLYLESTRLFAPEIHKRHLRPHDAAYKRLADEPPAGDDFTRDLRNAHRDRLRRWTEEFDEEEIMGAYATWAEARSRINRVKLDRRFPRWVPRPESVQSRTRC